MKIVQKKQKILRVVELLCLTVLSIVMSCLVSIYLNIPLRSWLIALSVSLAIACGIRLSVWYTRFADSSVVMYLVIVMFCVSACILFGVKSVLLPAFLLIVTILLAFLHFDSGAVKSNL